MVGNVEPSALPAEVLAMERKLAALIRACALTRLALLSEALKPAIAEDDEGARQVQALHGADHLAAAGGSRRPSRSEPVVGSG